MDSTERIAALLAPLVEADRLIREIDEPLRQSAPIGFELARTLCEGGDRENDCRAYHAVWQYFRLADVWRAVRIDGPVFVAAAEQLARDGRLSRVLISGAADYSMLAHIAHGARRGGATPSFDVVDRCKTALRMNEWYAAQRGSNVRTFRSDVLAFRPDRPYDLICTHSFFQWHSLPERALLFRTWHDWLAPGGRLCFSSRVSPEALPYDAAARSRKVEALTAKVLEQLANSGVALPCPEWEFVELLRSFGLPWRIDQPAMSLETLRSWIADAGLELELAIPVTKILPEEEDPPFPADRGPRRVRIWFQARRP